MNDKNQKRTDSSAPLADLKTRDGRTSPSFLLAAIIDPCRVYDPMMENSTRIANSLGYIPHWLSNEKYKHLSIVEAIHEQYAHGGGWHSFKGFTHTENGILSYPDDPDTIPLVKYERTTPDGKTEIAYQYPYGWVMVLNDDNSIRVARID